MFWLDNELKNPLSGAKLKYDSPHSLTDGAMRFPIIKNIPYLRVNRDKLRAPVLERLDAGDERGALVLLLQDRDDWATGMRRLQMICRRFSIRKIRLCATRCGI